MKRTMIIGAALGALAAGAAAAQDTTPEAVFGFVDANSDGVLSFEEINEANASVTQEVFAEFDADGNGSLSMEEFANLFTNGPPPPGM